MKGKVMASIIKGPIQSITEPQNHFLQLKNNLWGNSVMFLNDSGPNLVSLVQNSLFWSSFTRYLKLLAGWWIDWTLVRQSIWGHLALLALKTCHYTGACRYKGQEYSDTYFHKVYSTGFSSVVTSTCYKMIKNCVSRPRDRTTGAAQCLLLTRNSEIVNYTRPNSNEMG